MRLLVPLDTSAQHLPGSRVRQAGEALWALAIDPLATIVANAVGPLVGAVAIAGLEGPRGTVDVSLAGVGLFLASRSWSTTRNVGVQEH